MAENENKEEREAKEIEERSAPQSHVVYEAIYKEGEDELERSTAALVWSGLAAGLSMGFSFLVPGLLHAHLPDAEWRPLISSLGYSLGFLIIVLGRQQLFTENTLTVILPLLRGKTSIVNVARLWVVVLLANLVGAVLFALVLAKTEIVGEVGNEALKEIAIAGTATTFIVTVLRGVFAGWLIAMMVWLLPFAESARIWVIIILTYVVGLGGMSHVIAGSVEAAYLAIRGLRTWNEFLTGFTLPSLVGNIIGGVSLVAALAHAQVVADKEERA